MRADIYRLVNNGKLKTKEELEEAAKAKQDVEATAPKSVLNDDVLRNSWLDESVTLEVLQELAKKRDEATNRAINSSLNHEVTIKNLSESETLSRVIDLMVNGKGKIICQ